MPYTKLTNVANYNALLGEIRNFINATGDWTIHRDLTAALMDIAEPIAPATEPEPAEGRELIVKQGVCLAGMRSTTRGAGANCLYLHDGVPNWASSDIDKMNNNSGVRYTPSAGSNAGGDQSCRMLRQKPGPFPTAHLFTNDPSTYCHVVIEVSAGVYNHLVFGNLEKYGTWTGGGYYGLTHWEQGDTFIDTPSYTGHAVPFDNSPSGVNETTVYYVNGSDKWLGTEGMRDTVQRRQMRATMRGGFGRAFINIPESFFSGLVALAPILVGAVRVSDSPDTIRFIGRVPDMRAINCKNFAPGETYTIGSDEWVIFPICAKNGAVDQHNSGVFGVAYLKLE